MLWNGCGFWESLKSKKASSQVQLVSILMLGALLSQCGADVKLKLDSPKNSHNDSLDASSVKNIIGRNDLVYVRDDESNLPTRYQGLKYAFGHMSTRCTASHIGNGYAITAGHCFVGTGAKNYRNYTEGLSCRGVNVSFGWTYLKNRWNGHISNCLEIVALQFNGFADFAVFRIDNPPPAALPVDTRSLTYRGETLSYFGHPAGHPLTWSQFCGNLGRHSNSGFFNHNCDALGGSSGAPILRDGDQPKLIGVHNGTYGSYNYGSQLMYWRLRNILFSLRLQ